MPGNRWPVLLNGEPGRRPRHAVPLRGASRNKPFCDGTHARIGFSSG